MHVKKESKQTAFTYCEAW